MIYVDGLRMRKNVWGNDQSAHLVSDTSLAELKAFAESIRLPAYWLQAFIVPHFELSDYWRRRAVRAGAVDCAGSDRETLYLDAVKRYVQANPLVGARARDPRRRSA